MLKVVLILISFEIFFINVGVKTLLKEEYQMFVQETTVAAIWLELKVLKILNTQGNTL